MISIKEKEHCCGCYSCVQRCPKQCITMREDAEGFLYPKVDESACIDCGLCEKVCPVINQEAECEPLEVLAAKNPNEKIRKESSSGGVFTLLAESVIDEGGIVFGACFDERWEVVHQSAENKADLARFRGSKYVQSKVMNTYREAEVQLKAGRKVLYSGTPCQIAGLKRFLRKDYENLLTLYAMECQVQVCLEPICEMKSKEWPPGRAAEEIRFCSLVFPSSRKVMELIVRD